MNAKKFPIAFEPSFFDIHLAKFLVQRSNLKKKKAEDFKQIIQQLSAAVFAGHSCLHTAIPKLPSSICIDRNRFKKKEQSPLVYDNGRLYFYRYYNYENRLAKQLRTLARSENDLTITQESLHNVLLPLFDGKGLKQNEPDLQRQAAEVALQKPLTIISGGPGTGKTTTIVKILAAILTLTTSNSTKETTKIPEIALAAPTGKAAMRLAESIHKTLANSSNSTGITDNISRHIPAQASTLHRLLGVHYGRPDFIHNQNNPLDFDLVVIDEASMVDLALMSKLVDSLKPQARLILLGDKDQLASVESGAVLADIIEALPECSVQLKKSWRFDEGIGSLAKAINAGDHQQTESIFADKENKRLHRISIKDSPKEWLRDLAKRYDTFMDMAQDKRRNKNGWNDEKVAELFAQFNSFRILCALRKGKQGMEQINNTITTLLAEKYSCKREMPKSSENWYPGRPVMITTNDYTLELFNGDIGICLPGRNGEQDCVWFESHSKTEKNRFRILSINRLPQSETTFAMTIHKSQGSEFEDVAVILPEKSTEGKGCHILTKELLYTAITRAKKEVLVIAEKEVLKNTINAQIERTGGLQERLGA